MSDWPPLPLDAWQETYDTLHMWTQIVGKVTLALTAPVNHFWNIAFAVTPRGLSTPMMAIDGRALSMTFDFLGHRLLIESSDDGHESIALEPMTVADFYQRVMDALHRMRIRVHIWTMPVEVPNPVPFDQDTVHHSYDEASALAFWHILVAIKPILERFRGHFVGKSSPIHFFWGSFDLAVTRFSGRRAPDRPGADLITRESYSHEVISHGFWPGGGPVHEPAFYAYAAPEPTGFRSAAIAPPAARYDQQLSEFILPYEAVRTAPNPEGDLTRFLTSTYDAGATLGGWNRTELERA